MAKRDSDIEGGMGMPIGVCLEETDSGEERFIFVRMGFARDIEERRFAT